jgi:CHAT domain-containing protein
MNCALVGLVLGMMLATRWCAVADDGLPTKMLTPEERTKPGQMLDLSGFELAVLSACDTGLGHVAGGEGTFGLQRAFHLAGTRDVIASWWKVPDQRTAALMAEFYRNLWDKEKPLSPQEALRQAQPEDAR